MKKPINKADEKMISDLGDRCYYENDNEQGYSSCCTEHHDHGSCCSEEHNHEQKSHQHCNCKSNSIKTISNLNDECCCTEDYDHDNCCSEEDKHNHDHESCCLEEHNHEEKLHQHHNSIKVEQNSGKSKIFVLKGLACAGCAVKIESKVNGLEEVEEAVLNFTTSTLIVNVKNKKFYDAIEQKVKAIVTSLEPDVVVYEKNSAKSKEQNTSKDENKLSKLNTIRLIIGTSIFAFVLMFKLDFYIELVMYLTSYALIGGDIVLKAIKNIGRGQVFDENFLMVIATLGAFAIGEFPEAVAVMLFFKIGEAFQDKAVNKSRKSIADLMDIRPETANLKIGEVIKQVSPEEVQVGDLIVVKPGEKIPLDGMVIEGESMIDTSALTGESIPRKASKGNEVLSGFINKNGVLTLKVTKSFSQSAVSKILDLVENAGSKKARTEQFITKFARYYTPVVVGLAVLLAVVPPLVTQSTDFSDWIKRALIFLVVSCPCALVVSVPLGFFGGIGTASKNGILVKGGNYLEALNDINTIVFDKTGTLTKGVFEVVDIKTFNNITEEKLLEYAAYAEVYSNHPIGNSITKAYGKDIDKAIIKDYKEKSGYGIKVLINNQEVLVGNVKLMNQHNISFEQVNTIGTIVYVAVDNEFLGYIIIADEVKEDSVLAIKNIKNLGMKTIMLTGDNKIIGETVGNNLNIDKVYAELLPQDKVEMFENIQNSNTRSKKIAFVGDGVNDAPVLTRADIGIAMGGLGSDAAIEAADVVLMTDEVSKLSTAINIAKYTRKIVIQNIIFALVIKIVVLAMGALGVATMWEAVFADVGVTLIAVLNTMRIMKFKV
ncbi:heavy metal translocating P-type ATPase [Haloimpatiens sp. FM7330]|uniref:heavy metal translocating P-type ATPase n=1 Tax=Haloimpatiens sp. FM7330 TaxID=3298610 RepID=UPI003625F912